MIDADAETRDATYLACQLHTNGVVLQLKGRMQAAQNKLRTALIEVTEEARIARTKPPKISVEIPVPQIDLTPSVPRPKRDSDREIPVASVLMLPRVAPGR
jgi:hypothetical protein